MISKMTQVTLIGGGSCIMPAPAENSLLGMFRMKINVMKGYAITISSTKDATKFGITLFIDNIISS